MAAEHLQKDLAWFEAHRAELLEKGKGRWVAVYNQTLIGIFDSFDEAYDQALGNSQSPNVLVKQILEKDEPLELCLNYRLGLLDAYLST